MFNKKVFYSIFIIAGLVVLFPQISFGVEQFSRDLSFGLQQDLDVIKLQEFLSNDGLYSGPITGNFFSLTLKAVKAFQSREGIIPVAGYFGPKTRARVNELLGAQIEASNQQAIVETEQIVTQSTNSQIANNFINSIKLQLEALLKQVVSLQQQVKTQQNQNPVSPMDTLEIISVNITPDKKSAKVEWQTNKPTESKVFISGGNLSSKIFLSESGFSSNHVANISSLSPTTNYSYEITALNELGFIRKSGVFTTLDAFVADILVDKEEIKNDSIDFVTISVVTKLTNGEILQNKSLKIKINIYGSGGAIVTSFDESKLSDSQGIIIFKTQPTSYYDRCGMGMTITIIDNEDGHILFSKNIGIKNVKPVSPGSGMPVACA